MSERTTPTIEQTAADILRESGHDDREAPDPKRVAELLQRWDRGGTPCEPDDPEPCTHGGHQAITECVCGLHCCHHTRFADDGVPRWATSTGCHQFRPRAL